MDEQGLWNLFFLTGSPLVWLAIRRLEEDRAQRERAQSALAAEKEVDLI